MNRILYLQCVMCLRRVECVENAFSISLSNCFLVIIYKSLVLALTECDKCDKKCISVTPSSRLNRRPVIDCSSAQMKEIGIITQAPAGAGRFYISFQLFSDEKYKHPFGFRPHLSRDGIIRGRVTLHNHTSLSRATVQLTRCWATPEADGQGGFDLIRNL